MSELFDDMMSGLNDAEAFLAGKEKGRFRVHVPEKVRKDIVRAAKASSAPKAPKGTSGRAPKRAVR